MLLHPVILSCILGFALGALTFPLRSAFTGADAVAVADEDADVDDEPDLLKMLDFFKGKSDVGELTTFLKQYKAMEPIMAGLMEICVPCKAVYTDVSKSNTALRILGKVAQGHVPDIKDMYDLATKGVGNIAVSLHAAQKQNKKFMKITSMLDKGSAMFSSAPQMNEFLNDLTGRQFTFDPELVKEVAAGSVKFTKNNVAQLNLLLMMSSWAENYGLTNKIVLRLNNPPFDFIKPLEILRAFNTSSLSKIKAISGGMDNNKYTVSGGQMTFVTYPGVEKVLQDLQKMSQLLKTKSQDQSAAESLFIDAISDLSSLTFRILKSAESQRKIPPV